MSAGFTTRTTRSNKAVVNGLSTNVAGQGDTGRHVRPVPCPEPPANPRLSDTTHNRPSRQLGKYKKCHGA